MQAFRNAFERCSEESLLHQWFDTLTSKYQEWTRRWVWGPYMDPNCSQQRASAFVRLVESDFCETVQHAVASLA